MGMLRKVPAAAVLALAGVAVTEQLGRPREERTWRGDILGVPYDFRPVTEERIRERVWNPGNSSLIVPQVFGIGWTVNVYRLLHPAQR